VPQQQEIQGPHHERVLYIDDEEALVFLISKNLERLGCQVTGFTDPETALREFRSRPGDFDVVVTDISMPRMSGFELARQLLTVRPEIPIVVTSGYMRPEDQAKAQQLGIQEVVLKPCRIDDLTRAFERISAGQSSAAGSSSS
jgi:CheY-like chemotaxis protein